MKINTKISVIIILSIVSIYLIVPTVYRISNDADIDIEVRPYIIGYSLVYIFVLILPFLILVILFTTRRRKNKDDELQVKKHIDRSTLFLLYPLTSALLATIVVLITSFRSVGSAGLAAGMIFFALGISTFFGTYLVILIIGIIRYRLGRYRINLFFKQISRGFLLVFLISYFMNVYLNIDFLSWYTDYREQEREEQIKDESSKILDSINYIDQDKMEKLQSPQFGKKCMSYEELLMAHNLWIIIEQKLIDQGQKNLTGYFSMDVYALSSANDSNCKYVFYDLNKDSYIYREDLVSSLLTQTVEYAVDNNVNQIISYYQNYSVEDNQIQHQDSSLEEVEAPVKLQQEIIVDKDKNISLQDSYNKNKNTCTEEDLKHIHDLWVRTDKELQDKNKTQHISKDLFTISSDSNNNNLACNLNVKSPIMKGYLTISFGDNVPRIDSEISFERVLNTIIKSILPDYNNGNF